MGNLLVMERIRDLEAAEAAMRRLLENGDLPPPDEVEYREDSVLFLWRESKLAVVVDLDERVLDVEPPAAA